VSLFWVSLCLASHILIVLLSVVVLGIFMLSFAFSYCYAELSYAGCCLIYHTRSAYDIHTDTFRAESSAQVSSCQLKFVQDQSQCGIIAYTYSCLITILILKYLSEHLLIKHYHQNQQVVLQHLYTTLSRMTFFILYYDN
jgi:hypothetical protein